MYVKIISKYIRYLSILQNLCLSFTVCLYSTKCVPHSLTSTDWPYHYLHSTKCVPHSLTSTDWPYHYLHSTKCVSHSLTSTDWPYHYLHSTECVSHSLTRTDGQTVLTCAGLTCGWTRNKWDSGASSCRPGKDNAGCTTSSKHVRTWWCDRRSALEDRWGTMLAHDWMYAEKRRNANIDATNSSDVYTTSKIMSICKNNYEYLQEFFQFSNKRQCFCWEF
jgi:hypothetical protein